MSDSSDDVAVVGELIDGQLIIENGYGPNCRYPSSAQLRRQNFARMPLPRPPSPPPPGFHAHASVPMAEPVLIGDFDDGDPIIGEHLVEHFIEYGTVPVPDLPQTQQAVPRPNHSRPRSFLRRFRDSLNYCLRTLSNGLSQVRRLIIRAAVQIHNNETRVRNAAVQICENRRISRNNSARILAMERAQQANAANQVQEREVVDIDLD